MMSKDEGKDDNLVRAAVIGAGSGVAPRHFESFVPEAGAQVVAGVETNDEPRRQIEAARGIPMFDSMAELARSGLQLDLAVVCAPDALHAEIARQALVEHHWNVLCEKPLAEDEAKARMLYELAQREGLYLCHALQRRYMTPQIDRLVAEGAIGDVRFVEVTWLRRAGMPAWRRALRSRGGVLSDLGIHALGHGLAELGLAQPVRVTTRVSNAATSAAVEDEAFVLADFAGGESLTLTVAFDRTLDPADGDRLRLYVVGRSGEIEAELLTSESADQAEAKRPQLRLRINANGVDVRALKRLRTTTECHLEQALHVVEAIRRGGPAPWEEVERELRLMRLFDATYRSGANGGRSVELGARINMTPDGTSRFGRFSLIKRVLLEGVNARTGKPLRTRAGKAATFRPSAGPSRP
jgi:predicted dehydrogenase